MIKNIVKIAAGFLMLVTVFIGYMPQPEYLVEMTCVTNTLGGLLLFTEGILSLAGKKTYPGVFHRNLAVGIFLVFLVCMGSLTGAYSFNFKGAFFFLHVVNPVLFLACYACFVREQGSLGRMVLTAPLLTMGYLLFDYIRGQLTGAFVYGFANPGDFSLAWAFLAGIVIYAFVCLLGLFLFALNRFVHKSRLYI